MLLEADYLLHDLTLQFQVVTHNSLHLYLMVLQPLVLEQFARYLLTQNQMLGTHSHYMPLELGSKKERKGK